MRRIAKRRLAQALLALVVAFVAPPSVATADGSRELVNPALGEEYRNWALGSISYLLSKKETKEYGQLTNDDQAASFVAAFWAARDAGLRTRYEERAAQADELFAEDDLRGRASDRGGLHVVYGPPEDVRSDAADSNVTIWLYPAGAPKGLDGRRPKRIYRFAEQAERVRFYVPGAGEFAQERRTFNSVPRARPPQP